MANFYPNPKNLFTEHLSGRKLAYSPTQIAEQFLLYISDLEANQIDIETEYYKQRQQEAHDGKTAEAQKRKQKFYRPPKITDFVVRWLGKSLSWWSDLSKSKRQGVQFSNIKKKIEQYCYDAKFDGAVIGIYNANIIARDLGLRDKVEIEAKPERTIEEIEAEIKRLDSMQRLAKYAE